MKYLNKLTLTIFLFSLLSCSNSEMNKTYESAISKDIKQVEESLSELTKKNNHQEYINSLASSSQYDGEMRFIRKAQIKFRALNIETTTKQLEKAIIDLNGIITYTKLYSDIVSIKKIAITKDSSLSITKYNMFNNVVIRVPNKNLDSLLRVISKTVDFMDERIITAEEITLTELSNSLEKKRLVIYQNQVKNATRNNPKGDITKITEAFDALLNNQAKEDAATIRNLKLDYDVNFSQVNLSIYQAKQIDKVLIENEINIEAFQPSFFTQLGNALSIGWSIFKNIVLGVSQFWFLFVFGGIVYFILRKMYIRRIS